MLCLTPIDAKVCRLLQANDSIVDSSRLYWTRNRPGMEGAEIGIGPEWSATGLKL